MTAKIHCSIMTPEKFVYEGESDHTVIEAFDGKRGFLINHTAFVTRLGYGEVRIHNGDDLVSLYIEDGIVEMLNNRLSVLAENAFYKEDLKRDVINKKLENLNEMMKAAKDPLSDEGKRIDIELSKSRARLKYMSK
jgi:F-type H+-transporting ATPase subunit epsilon